MNVKRFFSKRVNILVFVTIIFVLIGLLFGFIIPQALFNRQIRQIEQDLHDLAFDYENVTEVGSTQVLYIYDNEVSTMLTSSGYIENINIEVEEHLIHWSHEQLVEEVETLLYEDDFQEKNYIYYVYVVNDSKYVVTFEDTKEVITFVDGFRNTSLIAVVVFYLFSLIFSSTIFSSRLIKEYSLFDPVTNLNTKISLLNKFKNKDLSEYNIIYFNIYNLDHIFEAMGIRNNESILKSISFNISRSNHNSIYQLFSKEYVLVSDRNEITKLDFQSIINQKVDKGELSIYQFKVKTIMIQNELLKNGTMEDLLKKFKFAFSYIQSKKTNQYIIEQSLIDSMEKELYYQSRLSSAISSDCIQNFYQPKVDPKTGKIIGAEALSRWVDNEEVISPANYIHIAEANGLIYDIDMISFKNSVKMIRELSEKDLISDDFKLSSNFSPISLKNVTFMQLKDIIETMGVDPKHVSIEITETVLLEFDVIQSLLQEISDYGICIEIDDFSAGNSSFSVLASLNADVVKLDRGILPEKQENEREKFIYNSLVDISKKLGFKIISEGVESNEQKRFVEDIGVGAVQGYFYSKPLSKDEFLDYLRQHR